MRARAAGADYGGCGALRRHEREAEGEKKMPNAMREIEALTQVITHLILL